MTICRELTLVKQTPTHVTGSCLKCRSWGCDYCEPERRAQLVAKGINGKPNKFVTLTIDPAVEPNPNRAASRLAHAWRLLRKRLMRKYGWTRLPFLAVFEAHESGMPHLHLLVRSKYIPQADLSKGMADLLQSPIVHISAIRGRRQSARYAAKYLSKENGKFGTCKRYWSSQDYEITRWVAREERTGEPVTWFLSRLDIDEWVRLQYELEGEPEQDGRGWYRFRRRRHWSEQWQDFGIL